MIAFADVCVVVAKDAVVRVVGVVASFRAGASAGVVAAAAAAAAGVPLVVAGLVLVVSAAAAAVGAAVVVCDAALSIDVCFACCVCWCC